MILFRCCCSSQLTKARIVYDVALQDFCDYLPPSLVDRYLCSGCCRGEGQTSRGGSRYREARTMPSDSQYCFGTLVIELIIIFQLLIVTHT